MMLGYSETRNNLTIFFENVEVHTETAVQRIDQEFMVACEQAQARGKRKIIIDFHGVESIPSRLIGSVVLVNRFTRTYKMSLELDNVKGAVWDVFRLTRLHGAIRINGGFDGDGDGSRTRI